MTDLKYRIIARDKDGKELGHEEYFNRLRWPAIAEHYPGTVTLTIERLPPEEAEPRRVFLNQYGDWFRGGIYSSRHAADNGDTGGRTACVQFIEAKITASQVERLTDYLSAHGWIVPENRKGGDLRAALAAALGIEP